MAPIFLPTLTCLPSVPGNNFSKFSFSQAKEAKIVVQSGQPANAYELNVGKKTRTWLKLGGRRCLALIAQAAIGERGHNSNDGANYLMLLDMSFWSRPRPRPLPAAAGAGKTFARIFEQCVCLCVCVGQVYADVVDYICRSCGRPPFGLVLPQAYPRLLFLFNFLCVLNFPSLTFRFQHFSCEQVLCVFRHFFPP